MIYGYLTKKGEWLFMKINELMNNILEKFDEKCISPNDYNGYVIDLEQAVSIIQEEFNKYNDGWIYCKDQLPNEKETTQTKYDSSTLSELEVEHFLASELVNVVVKDLETDEIFTYDDCTVNGQWTNFDGKRYEVLAWKYLSEPPTII